ncbi:MAG: zinc ribbon domain-containing protein [Acidobacteria bacterium]|nr:zinc ribbon domain-containing protein [Acidobacteriota bacterium]
MHCQNCGQKLRSKARFCNNCGQSVVERFGSALLQNMPKPVAPDSPTENLSPKTRTAPNQHAPSTLEQQAQFATDELGLRGTGRQEMPKHTLEEVRIPLDARTTVVEAKAYKELAPTRPAELPTPPHAATTVVDVPALPPPPPVAAFVPPPQIKVSANPAAKEADVEFLTPSTQELQSIVANKPFFTRMLKPNAQNAQHKYLIYAVPLVLLAALIVFIAFLWLR